MTRSAGPLELSIVIPAYNEAERIRPTLKEYAGHFSALYGGDFEIVVVLNGCTDGTRSVVEELMADAPQLRLMEFAEPLGKGGAIWKGLGASTGSRLAFVDADNMVRAPETEKLLHELDRFDLAIASRFGPGASKGQTHPLLRRVASRAVRSWTGMLLGLPFRDTQCGSKTFRAVAWQAIAPHVHERGWAFDLDVLTIATRLGLTVAEVPVEWQHVAEGSKVQLWKAGPQLLLATLRIRRRRPDPASGAS